MADAPSVTVRIKTDSTQFRAALRIIISHLQALSDELEKQEEE